MTSGTAFGAPLLVVPALALVLGLIWLAGRLARRGWLRIPHLAAQGARLTIVQTLPIDSRRRLHLVRCDETHLLLLCGGTPDILVVYPTGVSPSMQPSTE